MNYDEMTPNEIRDYNVFMVVMYQTMFVNDTAVMSFYDLLHALEKRPDLYKYKVKYRARILRQQIKIYNAANDRRTEYGNNFLADIFEAMSDEISSDVQKLEYAIRNFLHRLREKEVDMLTRIVLAETWAKGMVGNVDMNHKEFTGKLPQKYLRAMEHIRHANLRDAVLKLVNEIHGVGNESNGQVVELSDSPEIFNGFQAILIKLSDPKRIMRLCVWRC